MKRCVFFLVSLVYLAAESDHASHELNLVLDGGVHEEAVSRPGVAARVDEAFLNQLVCQHVLNLKEQGIKANQL